MGVVKVICIGNWKVWMIFLLFMKEKCSVRSKVIDWE